MTSRPLFRSFNRFNIDRLPQYHRLTPEQRFEIDVVARVLPFRVNGYVADELNRWNRIPDDPVFRLVFPSREMLLPKHFDLISSAVRNNRSEQEISRLVSYVRSRLNPHPAGQTTVNVPSLGGEPLKGVQHKYRETVLIFPSQGQTCHAYCSFCFRWPQFVGKNTLKFHARHVDRVLNYLKVHREVTDVLLSGGDPMVMNARWLSKWIEPLLSSDYRHIRTIRIGTKSISYWPHRYLTDKDSSEVLRLFERVVKGGRHLALMAHINHPVETSTWVAREAIRRIRETGAVIRTQSPLIRHINDRPEVWAQMWEEQVRMGCVPYYMFIERNTGPKHHFSVPLARAWNIYRKAVQQVSGLGRTASGPTMSAFPGKVCVEGVANVKGEKVFVLSFLQSRDPDWVHQPFFAKFDPEACWLNDLEPAFGEEFFFEEENREQAAS